MNWKKASGILVTLGVTATVIYIGYSYKFLSNEKDLASLKEKYSSTDIEKDLSEEEVSRLNKKVGNLTKKQLEKVFKLSSKKELTKEESDNLDKLIKKWGYKNIKK